LHNTRYYWRVQAISDTNTSDWSPTWNFVTIIPSDVAEAKSSDFSIAPQPVRNEAVVTYLNGKNTAISVELYDLKGTIVGTYNFTSLNEGTNKLRLDVSNLSNGIYNVIIKSGAEVHQAKMIKVD